MIIWGKVIRGEGRGKDLGFPTANIPLHKKIPEGIYISITKIRKKEYPSITFIGAARTFNQTDVKAETYILDFSQQLYGKWLSVVLLKKVRNNQTFENVPSLLIQIRKDVVEARHYFNS